MKYNFGTLEEAINYLIDNSSSLSSNDLKEIKSYIKERFNLPNTEIIKALVKAINRKKEMKD